VAKQAVSTAIFMKLLLTRFINSHFQTRADRASSSASLLLITTPITLAKSSSQSI
jgi:hypothetical protein